jgi:hypothetical protein
MKGKIKCSNLFIGIFMLIILFMNINTFKSLKLAHIFFNSNEDKFNYNYNNKYNQKDNYLSI